MTNFNRYDMINSLYRTEKTGALIIPSCIKDLNDLHQIGRVQSSIFNNIILNNFISLVKQEDKTDDLRHHRTVH